MLTKSEIKLLSEIGEGPGQKAPLQEVAERLGWGDSYTSRVVSSLRGRGYVDTERARTKKLVSANDVQPIEQLGTLTSEFGHVDFPELIAGAGLKVVYYLDEPRTARELAERSHVSRGTVYRRLNELQRVGIVGKNHSNYELTQPFSRLADFARGVAHHEHRQEALKHTTNVTIVWETHDEYLFSCDSALDKDGFHQTGPSMFEDFGVPLLTRERFHYFRSDHLSELTVADLVCHTLLVEDDTRYRTYSLLLLASHDVEPSTLEERARYYEREADHRLTALTAELQAYLDSGGEDTSERLPAWEDFKSTAADYDISV